MWYGRFLKDYRQIPFLEPTLGICLHLNIFNKHLVCSLRKIIFINAIAAIAATVLIVIIMSITSFPTDTPRHASAVGVSSASGHGDTNNQTSPPSTTSVMNQQKSSSDITASSSNKTLYLFTAEHDGVNQTRLGIPPDTFSPDVLEVNTGDNVTIHFYNLDTTDSHTFTIGAPYNIDKVVTPGQNASFTFKGADQGIYRFYCRFHEPTMTGQLVVLAPPIVEKPTTTAASANTTTTT